MALLPNVLPLPLFLLLSFSLQLRYVFLTPKTMGVPFATTLFLSGSATLRFTCPDERCCCWLGYACERCSLLEHLLFGMPGTGRWRFGVPRLRAHCHHCRFAPLDAPSPLRLPYLPPPLGSPRTYLPYLPFTALRPADLPACSSANTALLLPRYCCGWFTAVDTLYVPRSRVPATALWSLTPPSSQ